jgi:TRAP-type C4-dicarboxylate transport system substrate-binding protein
MKAFASTAAALVAAFGLLAGGACLSQADAQSSPNKLVMVGAWKPNVSPAADIGIKFKDTVNKMSGGKIEIVFKGASDVIPTFDQPEALVKGVFDIWYGAPNYWAGIVKGGYVTEMSPFEIPDNGPGSDQFAFMNKLYEAHGVHYLGHMTGEPDTGNHFLYTQKSISKIEDLKGMKIRVPPLTRFFITAIGAEPVTLPPGDIYLALERGTVDGFTWPYFDGFTNFGWQEVSKFLVAHPLYRDGTAVIINLAKWKSLPDDAKQILNKAAADTQQWARGWVSAHQAGQLAKMKAAGMKVVELSPAEAKRWEDTSRAALWAHFKSVMSPQEYAEARRLFTAK